MGINLTDICPCYDCKKDKSGMSCSFCATYHAWNYRCLRKLQYLEDIVLKEGKE